MSIQSKTVGDIKVTAVRDGFLQSSLNTVLRMDMSICESATGVARDAVLAMPTYVFLLQTGERTMLIDAGAGLTMGPTMGKALANLKTLGVMPDAIDAILVTHLHPDHVDGLIDESGRPKFPNADLFVHEIEAAFWLDGPLDAGTERAQARRPKARAAVAPYRDRLRRVPDGEVMPGISAVLLPGHTPGHTGWMIASGSDKLLMWGDVVHIAPLQGPHPEAVMVFDVDPDQAHATRLRTLERVITESLPVAGSHLGAPGFARVKRAGAAYEVAAAE